VGDTGIWFQQSYTIQVASEDVWRESSPRWRSTWCDTKINDVIVWPTDKAVHPCGRL